MNNINNFDKFIESLESIKMTKDEKNKMRNNLASFTVSYTPVVSPYHKVISLTGRGLSLAFVLTFFIGFMSNFMSGDALPGDTLYPVKLAHEELKLSTTFNTKKKINYEIRELRSEFKKQQN